MDENPVEKTRIYPVLKQEKGKYNNDDENVQKSSGCNISSFFAIPRMWCAT